MSERPAVFLDRDGTLIEAEGYLGDPTLVRALPGVREALAEMAARGYARIVVTNQSGVARGFFTPAAYAAVTAAVETAVGSLDACYACFHLESGVIAPWNVACTCRKPLPGMLVRAAAEHDIDLAASVLVGDDLRDLQAAVAAGVRPILVRTGKGARNEPRLAAEGLGDVAVVDGLADVLPLLGPAARRRARTSRREPARVILDRGELAEVLAAHRAAGREIVMANGCFDLLHAGHARYLRGAAAEGDVLVVAVNSDESVRRNKGPGRPLQPEADRAEVLAAIGCVDYVTIFGEPTADAILRALRPHVHAKGTDWAADAVPEAATVREIGGRVAIVGDTKTRSSSDLVERARRAGGDDAGC